MTHLKYDHLPLFYLHPYNPKTKSFTELVLARKRQLLRYARLQNSHLRKVNSLRLKNLASLVFDGFLSKTQKISVFLLTLISKNVGQCPFYIGILNNDVDKNVGKKKDRSK